jgi:hypothetical protein
MYLKYATLQCFTLRPLPSNFMGKPNLSPAISQDLTLLDSGSSSYSLPDFRGVSPHSPDSDSRRRLTTPVVAFNRSTQPLSKPRPRPRPLHYDQTKILSLKIFRSHLIRNRIFVWYQHTSLLLLIYGVFQFTTHKYAPTYKGDGSWFRDPLGNWNCLIGSPRRVTRNFQDQEPINPFRIRLSFFKSKLSCPYLVLTQDLEINLTTW